MSEVYARKCAGKKRHASERRALEWAKITQIDTGLPMNAYHCEFCQQWHVGNALYANGRMQRMERMEAMKTTNLSLIVTSSPVNAVAGRVTSSGTHYQPVRRVTGEEWWDDRPAFVDADPSLMSNPNWNMTGVTYGLVTAVGYAGKNSGGDAAWFCRCVCGRYVRRKASTLRKKPASEFGPNCCPLCENARRLRAGRTSIFSEACAQ